MNMPALSEEKIAKIKKIFADAGAIITGDHFVYVKKPDGWFHGSDYVNKDAIYLFTNFVSELCQEISRYFWEAKIEAVVGPAVGGVALSQWTAHCLAHVTRQEVLAVFADEIENKRVIKRGYDKHIKGKRCLIVEDIINSGATVVKTINAVNMAGGQVAGVGCLCNRSGGKVTAETLGSPELFSLLDLDMKMYPEADCPICKEKGPESVRTDLGKGKEFLTRIGLA